jgi:RNA-directed DNA polymerase
MNPPPFLLSFSATDEFLRALEPDLRETYGNAIRNLVEQRLPPVVSIRCLATLFGFSPRFVGALYSRTHRYYRTFLIPKGRGQRIIHAPKVALKVIQKWFGFHLAKAVNFESAIFGFVEGRSAIAAAASHCGAEWVYSVDIEDFFNSTAQEKVESSLVQLGYSEHGANLIGKLCCYEGMLSQGSPASPVLSNLVFRPADNELIATAGKYDLRYTRYADDLVFSGKEQFPAELQEAVREIIESRGWRLAIHKEYLAVRPKRLKVHGLLVHETKPRLTKGYRNRIRAFQHLLETNQVAPEDISRFQGHISYSRSVNKIADRKLDET